MANLLGTTTLPPAEAARLIANVLEACTEYSIIGLDIDGNILLWNTGARRLYGWEPNDVIGKATWDLLHPPEDVEAGKPADMAKTALDEDKWEGTVVRLRRDGSRFPAWVVLTPRRDASGEPVGFLLMSKDISADIRLTEELEATQFYTRSLIELSVDALIATDPLGIVTDVNQQMEWLTGASREELVGQEFKTFFTDEDRAQEGIRQALAERKVTNYELTARAKDGRETVVFYNATTFNDRQGRLQGVFASARDITERKRFERALQEKNAELEGANLAKDGFLASLSHELRTPLNAILGFTGTLLMGLPGPLTEEQESQLKTVRSSARHLLAIINDLLDLAKIVSGKVDLALEAVDCRSVTQDVATSLRPMAEAKGLGFELDLPDDPVLARADRRALLQVLINLTNNAIKFTDEGAVRLVLQRHDDGDHPFATVAVVDTGIGISDADRARLFDAFEQVGDSGRHQEGTGLGLHISRKLIELLGGSITCESRPGRGSTFTVQLRES